MRKTAYTAPACILLLGAAGFILRKREWAAAWEEGVGFVYFGGAESLMVIALSLLAAAATVFFAASAVKNRSAVLSYEKAYGIRSSAVFLLYALSGIAMISGGALYFLENKSVGIHMMLPELMFSVLAVLSGIVFIIMALSAFKGKSSSSIAFLSIIPPLFFCFWLIMMYKTNAINPTLLEFCYRALALAACAMAFYYSAGYAYGKSRARMTVFTGLTAAYFCILSLADSMRPSFTLLFFASAVLLILNSGRFIGNLKEE